MNQGSCSIHEVGGAAAKRALRGSMISPGTIELEAPRPIFTSNRDQLADWLEQTGEPKYRAEQIYRWIVQKRADNFASMSDLPERLRDRLHSDWRILSTSVGRELVAGDQTKKLLVMLADGRSVECVLMREGKRRTVCLSTQVGCGMGCVFCASGLSGVERNLAAAEMIEQLIHAGRRLPEGENVTHIVVMGMGEPLANLGALLPALDFATSKSGLGISARHITVSTVGLPDRMRELADIRKPYHLAVSLHAPNQELREKIVPTARNIALEEILSAADYYREKSSRQLTFEYVLLADINDQPECAKELTRLLAKRDGFVNLIPFNPVSGLNYRTPRPDRVNQFASILRVSGLTVRIRKRKGSSIDAACGQLRRATLQNLDSP